MSHGKNRIRQYPEGCTSPVVEEGWKMKCIAVMAGQDTAPDENLFKQVKGIQCVEGCEAHYWLYIPPEVPASSIEEIRVRARAICRDFHHPLHPTRFELEV